MREAVGHAYILGTVITFMAIFIIIFASSIGYTSAFKARNRIISIIERDADTMPKEKFDMKKVVPDIDKVLGEIGYQVTGNYGYQTCDNKHGGIAINERSNYRYCLYQHTTPKGIYYSVVAYMYFEFPIIGTNIEIPIYGETKLLYQLK
jgi:hypothetical protein